MAEYEVARAEEIGEGERAVVQLEGKPIGVFNVDGEYRAYLSWCAHQSGPCCEGTVSGTSRAAFDADTLEVEVEWIKEEEILNCPWHGWEYDLETGTHLGAADASLSTYPVTVEDETVYLDAASID